MGCRTPLGLLERLLGRLPRGSDLHVHHDEATREINAYSDEKSDEYLLRMAQNGFVVEGNRVIPYVEGYNFKK